MKLFKNQKENETIKGTVICKLRNNKHMIASTHITNNEIFAYIAVLIFELLSRKFLLINI